MKRLCPFFLSCSNAFLCILVSLFSFAIFALFICAPTSVAAENFNSQQPNSHISDDLTEAEKQAAPDGYQIVHGYSFNFDLCGDSEFGKKYRNTLFDKLESCEFSEKVKKGFYRNAAKDTQEIVSQILMMMKKGSASPAKTIGGFSCKKFKEKIYTKSFETFRHAIEKYNNNEISLKDITFDIMPSCSQGASINVGVGTSKVK